MGSANLNDVGILLGLLIKRCHQFFQSREQDILDLNSSGDVHGGGVGVVTALQRPVFSLHLQIFLIGPTF